MKEKYIYSEGNVVAVDKFEEDSVDLQVRSYQDNIEEIFITENLLEELYGERREKIVEREVTSAMLKNKSNIKSLVMLLSIVSIIGSVSIGIGLLSAASIASIKTILITMLSCDALFAGVSALNYKKTKNKFKASSLQVEKIEEEIAKNKKLLEELKKDKRRDNEVNITPLEKVNVNYKSQLRELRKYLDLYYKIGYYEQKVYGYYKEGKINPIMEKLRAYSEDDLELVKTYFKQKDNKRN